MKRLVGVIILTQLIGRVCLALSFSFRIAIIGGGSSGIFSASSIIDTLQRNRDESLPSLDCIDVKIYESTTNALRSMQNHQHDGVLYDTSKKPRDVLNAGYPRGKKEITSLMTTYFPPMQQQKWFEDRGIEFKTNLDGTMILTSGEDIDAPSDDVVHDAILQGGVREMIETKAKVSSISKDSETGCFHLTVNNGERTDICDCIILATGNSHLGHQLAKSLGHAISKPARSCFEFVLQKDNPIFSYLEEGSSYHLPFVRLSYKVKIEGQKRPRMFKSEGSAQLKFGNNGSLILTGMAAFTLSSLAAFGLKDASYTGTLLAHFSPDYLGGKVEKIEEYLWQYRQGNPNKVVGKKCPMLHQFTDYDDFDWETDSFKTITTDCIPADLWQGLTQECGAAYGSPWSKMSPKKCRKLAEAVVGYPLEFIGRNTASAYPYINAGGITLSEIDMSTMKSKVVDGFFCCGQALDGDASHNTFSLMKSLATGKAAGENAAIYANQLAQKVS